MTEPINQFNEPAESDTFTTHCGHSIGSSPAPSCTPPPPPVHAARTFLNVPIHNCDGFSTVRRLTIVTAELDEGSSRAPARAHLDRGPKRQRYLAPKATRTKLPKTPRQQAISFNLFQFVVVSDQIDPTPKKNLPYKITRLYFAPPFP